MITETFGSGIIIYWISQNFERKYFRNSTQKTVKMLIPALYYQDLLKLVRKNHRLTFLPVPETLLLNRSS